MELRRSVMEALRVYVLSRRIDQLTDAHNALMDLLRQAGNLGQQPTAHTT